MGQCLNVLHCSACTRWVSPKLVVQARLANIGDNITEDNTERVRHITKTGKSSTWLVTKTDLVSSQSRNRRTAQNKSKTYQVGSTWNCSRWFEML